MNKIILASILAVFMSGCTDENTAIKTLDDAGFSEVRMTGWNAFSCSEDDFYHTGFIAKNQNGKTVDGTVCSSILFKGATIRF